MTTQPQTTTATVNPTQPIPASPSNSNATKVSKILEELRHLSEENQKLKKLYDDCEHNRSELDAKLLSHINAQDHQSTKLLEAQAAATAAERERERIEREFAEFRAKNNPAEFHRKVHDLEAQVEALQRHRVDNEGLQVQVTSLTTRLASLTDAKRADAETIDKMTGNADYLRRSYDALDAKYQAQAEAQRVLERRLAEAEAAAAERSRLAERVAVLEAQRAAAGNLGVLFCGSDAEAVSRIAGELSTAGRVAESIELQELAARLDAKYDKVQEEAVADRTARAKAEQELALFKGELKGNVMPEVQRLRAELSQLRGRYESLFECVAKIKPEMEALAKLNESQKGQIADLERTLYDKVSAGSSGSAEPMGFESFVEMRAANARLVGQKEAFDAAQKELVALRAEHAELVALRAKHEETEAQLAFITSSKRAEAVLDSAKQVVAAGAQAQAQLGARQCEGDSAEREARLEKEVCRLKREVLRWSKEAYEAVSANSAHDLELKKARGECERLRAQQRELAEQKARLEKDVDDKEKTISDMNSKITEHKEREWKLDNRVRYQKEEIVRYKANEVEMSAKIEKLNAEVAYHVSSLSNALDVRKDSVASYSRLKNFMQENHLREMYVFLNHITTYLHL